MTEQEKDIKKLVNQTISELMATDNVARIKKEIFAHLEGIDISDPFDLGKQCKFSHFMNLYNLVSGLESKPIQHIKSAMRDYIECDNPLWMDILKRMAA